MKVLVRSFGFWPLIWIRLKSWFGWSSISGDSSALSELSSVTLLTPFSSGDAGSVLPVIAHRLLMSR